jgi:uncharacterized repeat protein (TIGR04052 family)
LVFALAACSGDESGKSVRPADRTADAASSASADAAASDAATSDAAASTGLEWDAALDAAQRSDADVSAPRDEDIPGQTVTIRFRAKLGDADLRCGEAVSVPRLGRVEPHELKFYLQDVSLIDASGAEVPLRLLERPPFQTADLALLDFDTEACSAGSAELNTEIVGKVPAGDYRGIAFTNGVPEKLNHADPDSLPMPLRVASMYWDWFQGFKFLAAEVGAAYSGSLDEAGEDAGVAPSQSILHVGSVGCGVDAEMQVSCTVANRNRIRLPTFDLQASVIVADLAAVFADADARTQTFCHGGRASCAQVYRNVGLDLSTGKPLDTQRVYRVE